MADEEYQLAGVYDSREYKSSRVAYIGQCAIEYFVSIAVTDTFLAKILTEIGINDIMTGIISSFISVAFLCQMVSFLLAEKITHIKRTVLSLNMLSVLLFSAIYLVPILSVGVEIKTALVMAFILLGYFANYFAAPFLFKWANSFVAPKNRGEYSALKEMVSLFGGMLFTLILGYLVDYFELIGQMRTGFVVVAIIMFIMSICNLIAMLLIKAPVHEKGEHSVSLLEVWKYLFGNRNFINVIILTVLWNVAIYITTGYLGIYKIKELQISVGVVQLFNVVASLCRLLVSKPFGRYADRHSYANGIKMALLIAAVSFSMTVFTEPDTWWLIAIYTVLYAVSLAGINQNMFNITYSYVESDYLVQAIAIKNSIGGISGFLASLVGGYILSYVQEQGNRLFGIEIYGQQVLAFFSLIIVVVLIGFIHFVVEKQKVMVQ